MHCPHQRTADGNYTDFFYNDNAKVVKVNGLWVPFYIEFSDNWNIKSISAYGHIVEREISSDPPYYFLTEWAETIVFNYSTNSKDDSWVFTRERVNEFVTEDGVSTLISANEDGELEYLRYSVKFYGAAKKTKTFPLDYALSRDEFFKETGKAKLKNGKIVLEKTESFTIGEAFDIDAIYEEYKLNYLGYDSADDVIERNIRREEGKESPIKETAVMPTEYHKGIWTDGYDDIIISKVTDDTITFKAGIFRMFGFNGIATLKDGVWEFIEDNSYDTDEDKIKGRLEFTQTSVKVIYDTCGRFSDYVKDGYTCYFTRHTSGGSTIDRLQPCGGEYYAPYNNEYLGLYKMSISSSTQYDFDYRVSVSVCNGSCKCDGWNYNQYDRDEIKAVAQYGVTDGWPYPVKVYYSKLDEAFKETDMQHYMELMRSATYVFDIGDGVHFELFIQRYDYISPLEDNELEILNSIAKYCFIELNFINGKTGDAISVDLGDAIGTPTDDIINAKFNVYSVEDYGEDRVKGLPVYDKSSSENCFKFVLEAKEDDLSAYLTYLNWHDNKYVEKELQTTLISSLMKGEACVICVDVYEPVSRVGLQLQHNGKFYRACPVLDEYGKPILESIDDRLGPTMHLNGEIYPVTVGGADTLQSQLDKLFEIDEFAERNSKMLEVKGLSKEFYVSLSYDDLRGAWLDNKSYKLVSDCDEEDLGNLKTEIFEWNGYIVLSRKSYEVGDTWFFKDGDVVEYHPNGVNSVTFSLDENGNLKYTRFYRKFNGKVHENATSVLEIAIERNDSLRETGSVTVNENGKLILNAEKKYTVSDVYDLDALFKEYSKTDEFKHKYPTCTTVDEVINYNLTRTVLKNHGVTDSRYKWLAAFLDGDAETLVDITILDSTTNGMIDGVPAKELMVTMLKEFFSEITIGEFKIVSMNDSQSLQFDFELLSSNTKYFPAGEYSVILRDGSMFTNPGVYFELRPGVVEIADEDEAFFAEQMFISWYGDAEYPNADSSYASLVLFYLYEEAFGLDLKGLTELTRAELEAIASEVYEDGFEINYWPFDYHEGENGEVGYYTVRGMGGTVEYHDVVSRVEKNGVITYDVVYYAEPTTLIPAKTVRYTVERTNSVYGFKLTGVEEIDNTGFDIFTQGM